MKFLQLDMYLNGGDERLVSKEEFSQRGFDDCLGAYPFPASVCKRVRENGSTRLESSEVAECLEWLHDISGYEDVTEADEIDLCMCRWAEDIDGDVHEESEIRYASL